MPGGPLVGLGRLVQLGLALAGQLGQARVGVGDGPVEVVQRGLVIGAPQRGQFPGLDGQVAGGGAETGGLGLEGDQVGGDGEAHALQPGRQVGDLGVGDAEPRADGLGALRGLDRLGVGGLLLLAGHPVAAQLAQLGVVQRAAHRARSAVDQGGGQLGAHVVDALPAQPGGLLEEVDVLQLGGQVRLGLAAGLGAGLDQGGRVQGRAVVAVGLGLDLGQPLGGRAGLVALAAEVGAPVPGRRGLGLDLGDLGGQRGGGGPGRLGGPVLVVGLRGQGRGALRGGRAWSCAAEPGRAARRLARRNRSGGAGDPVGQGPGLLLGRAGLGEGGGGALGLGRGRDHLGGPDGGVEFAAQRVDGGGGLGELRRGAERVGAAALAFSQPLRIVAAGPGPGPARPGGRGPARHRLRRGRPRPRPARRPRPATGGRPRR